MSYLYPVRQPRQMVRMDHDIERLDIFGERSDYLCESCYTS